MATDRINSLGDEEKTDCIKIKVKALVDKEKNKVVFAECDEDFVDVLFSFFTIPMGTIVSLTEKEKLAVPTKAKGCMNNLYTSVQNLDVKYFRNQECQNMLLHPRNGAPTQCRRLKISIDDINSHSYFYCNCARRKCTRKYAHKLLYHDLTYCANCGSLMKIFRRSSSHESDPLKAGAFLKCRLNQLVISDDLQLMEPPTSPSFSLLSELGVMDATALEDREFHIGEDEFLNLLTSSLVSKEALTQAFLNKNESRKENLFRMSSLQSTFRLAEAEIGKIRVKLFISKSKKIVCFAEVGEDFLDLVFSFLTIPLGHVLKQMHGDSIDGCIGYLYKSVEDLDVEYFKSSNEKEVLLNPKIPPKFGYENQLIGVEEVSCDDFFNTKTSGFNITVRDPKRPAQKEDKRNGAFMKGPAMFTVTDDLNVIPISAVSGVKFLKKSDVPLSDIQEHVVHVGNKEAVCLLVASFSSESALTHTFLKK